MDTSKTTLLFYHNLANSLITACTLISRFWPLLNCPKQPHECEILWRALRLLFHLNNSTCILRKLDLKISQLVVKLCMLQEKFKYLMGPAISEGSSKSTKLYTILLAWPCMENLKISVSFLQPKGKNVMCICL